MLTFGASVKERRGLTSQVMLAVQLGIHPATLYRIENGGIPSKRVERMLREWCPELPPVEREKEAA